MVTTDVEEPGTVERRTLAVETVLVVGIAVGLSAARSVLDFAYQASAPGGLSAGSATIVGSMAPGRPWIDLGLQVVSLAGLVLPALLAVHLARRSGGSAAAIGLRRERWGLAVGTGLAVAAAIGGLGLAAYLVSHAAGLSVTVVPASLPHVWWSSAVLVLAACANAVLEEVVLGGYLLHRCRQLGWPDWGAAILSGGIRGAYHLYQGLAGGLGNLLMGLVFARFYQRTGTIVPLLVAHAAIDVVAFLGYAELAGHVSWVPAAGAS
jgi:membrane protease YdiL (CAAX protease family)